MGQEGGGEKVTDADWAKPLRIHDSMSWIVFRRQFEAVAGHQNWASRENATYLLAVLQGQAVNVLQSVPAEVITNASLRCSWAATGTTNWAQSTNPS
jgi:hypothetical protein